MFKYGHKLIVIQNLSITKYFQKMLQRGRLLQVNTTSTGFSFRSFSSLHQNQLRRSICPVVLKDNSLVTRIYPNTVRLLSVSAIRWDGDPVVKEELIVELPPKPVPEASSSSELIFTLPDKPVPLDVAASLGEPSFESLGLASWWPSGRMQYFMENVRSFFIISILKFSLSYLSAPHRLGDGVVSNHRRRNPLHEAVDVPGDGDSAKEHGQHEQQHARHDGPPGEDH